MSNAENPAPKREFRFVYNDRGKRKTLKVPVPITIPFEGCTKETVHRLIQAHDIPCYLEQELLQSLNEFINVETQRLADNSAEQALDEVMESPQAVIDLIDTWSTAFLEEHSKYSNISDINEETAFSEMYHSLIHSPALETLLQLENNYAIAVQDLIAQRDQALLYLQEEHRQRMDSVINNLEVSATESDVNQLASRQVEDAQMAQIQWSSALSELQETQKREFREWVTKVHEDVVKASSDPTASLNSFKMKNRSPSTASIIPPTQADFTEEPRIEESFTIHLGAQMKTMHNLRLMCVDPLDMCRQRPAAQLGGSVLSQPQRIQTAMSLYSQSLAGMVLLVDEKLDFNTGIKKDFYNICQQSTDFHFPDLDKQMCLIQQSLGTRSRTRSTQPSSDNEPLRTDVLKAGDFYITRHSNLAQVHVVFHLVTDEGSLKSGHITGRHPAIVGVRHALHAASRQNIHKMTIPLLMVHDISEEMTVSWCIKRAELVMKCVKGFMMECVSWSGPEALTIQFIVPKGISEEMFHTFTHMLPNIFRVSTPLDLTKTTNKRGH